jgi:tetratricopeptide (TPR) repeat protein
MQAAKSTIEGKRKIRKSAVVRTTILVLFCLSSFSYQSPSLSGTPLPADLQEQLHRYREKDDLTGWIYGQIQWVAKAPATRAPFLRQAAERAWRIPRSNEEIQAWQDLLTNEGYALLMGGDIVHSTDAYTAAFEWARKHRETADATLVLENILKPLGNNYTRLGDYEQALFIHRKALAIAADLDDKDALAGTYGNLANASSNMGLPWQALDYCRQGLAVANGHSALCGLLLSEQADAFGQLRQPGAARKSIRKSISVLERAVARGAGQSTGYWLLTAYQQAGDIYAAQPEELNTALGYYRQALAWQNRLLQQHGAIRQRERAKLFQRLGALCARLDLQDRAAYWLDQCLSVLLPGKKLDSLHEADMYAENTLTDLLFTRAGLCQRQQQTDKALRLYTLCFAAEKRLLHELISGSSKERSVADSRHRYEEAIGTAWEAWERTQEKKYQQTILAFMENSKSQLLLEEVLQQQRNRAYVQRGDSLGSRILLMERAQAYYRKEAVQSGMNDSLAAVHAAQEKQIAWDLAQLHKQTESAHSAGAAKLFTAERFSLQTASAGPDISFLPDSLRTLLQDGQFVRSFFAGSKALYTVECSREGIRFAEKLILPGQWQDSVRAFIHTYFEQGTDRMIDHPSVYYGQAYTVYRQLFGAHPFQPGKEYILLPDGVLSLLPVETLVTEAVCRLSPDQWPFVVRQAFLSYGWSLQTLWEQTISTSRGNGFSGFFLSGAHPGDQRTSPLLNAVTAEKAGIRQVIREGNWYMDEQATTMAFRKALSRSAVMHISSHAFTKKDSLEEPHIDLFDESFYLFELKGLEQRPGLVVLSACRTGDGRMVTGEGVQSLARAFTAGGTHAVVAGWWNVNDETAAQLMKEFYSALVSGSDPAGTRINAARALRDAKLAWLNCPTVPYLYKLPYYWGSLNYQGNPTPLPSSFLSDTSSGRDHGGISQTIRRWWWIILLVLSAVLMILVMRRRS